MEVSPDYEQDGNVPIRSRCPLLRFLFLTLAQSRELYASQPQPLGSQILRFHGARRSDVECRMWPCGSQRRSQTGRQGLSLRMVCWERVWDCILLCTIVLISLGDRPTNHLTPCLSGAAPRHARSDPSSLLSHQFCLTSLSSHAFHASGSLLTSATPVFHSFRRWTRHM